VVHAAVNHFIIHADMTGEARLLRFHLLQQRENRGIRLPIFIKTTISCVSIAAPQLRQGVRARQNQNALLALPRSDSVAAATAQ
jgi:hypothetical protein